MNFLENWIKYITNLGTLWLLFLVIVVIVFFGAVKVVKYSALITENSKVEGAFIGVFVIAILASIPEIVTSVFQAASDNPKIAVSNVLGSNMFNMIMTAVCDLCFLRVLIFKKLNNYNNALLFTVFGVSALISMFIFSGNDLNIHLFGIHFGILPLLLIAIYIGFLIMSWFFESSDNETEAELKVVKENEGVIFSAPKSWMMLSLYGMVLVIGAIILNSIADVMVLPFSEGGYHIEEDTVGGTLLSWVMAMPEIVSLFLLVKKGLVNLAVSAIVGAQIFNFSILFFADLSYYKAPIIDAVGHDKNLEIIIISILIITFLFSIKVLIGSIFKKKVIKYWWQLSISVIIVLIYIISWIIIIKN